MTIEDSGNAVPSSVPIIPGASIVEISMIVPLYNVERYLADFLTSVSDQVGGRYKLQILLIDDGSSDSTLETATRLVRDLRLDAIVLEEDHRGVGAARNTGMANATGDWFTFPDPDDVLSPNYLRELAEFTLSPKRANSPVVSANIQRLADATGEIRDTHALRFKYQGKAKTVSLKRSPHYIQLSVASALINANAIRENNVRFSETIGNSEDALFLAELFSHHEDARLSVVPSAIYLYRQRTTGDSVLDLARTTAAGYIRRFKNGYMPLLKRLSEEKAIPEWLGNLLIYEYRWLFTRELNTKQRASVLTEDENRLFLQIVRDTLAYIPDEWILGYRINSLSQEIRFLLLAVKGTLPKTTPVHIARTKPRKGLVQLTYYFTGSPPSEEFRVRARDVEPVAAKTRRLDYFRQELLFQRIVWIPANSWIAADIDGKRVELFMGPDIPSSRALTEKQIWGFFELGNPFTRERSPYSSLPTAGLTRARRVRRGVGNIYRWFRREVHRQRERHDERRLDRPLSRMVRRSERWPWSSRYRDAWVLMDRQDMAQDNGEHMYRYLAKHHPETNPWFVINKDSPDWVRLKKDGFKLVAFGSPQYNLLRLNANHVISSQGPVDRQNPYVKRRGDKSHFTFLGHGVTKDDLSAWINKRDIALFITATQPEFESVSGDLTPYMLTSSDTVLSGLPRHDELLRKARALPEAAQRTLLIAPTWRDSLLQSRTVGATEGVLVEDFDKSEYALAWFGLLRDPELKSLADANGLRLAFLPHPNLQRHIGVDSIPDYVDLVLYENVNIQDVIVKASVMVTDYSSLAFEAAYVDIPVLYYQFDNVAVFSGRHTYRKGYYVYETDGFGPVTTTREDTISQLKSLAGDNGQVATHYSHRIERTFAYRDGKCSERVYRGIAALDELVKPL
ncbi:bifunctional glycosyltransferase/CDP-glycerol:glycerophosphate glycerophosphotransferase [Paramicrobacterium chengjingii]|uniref:bifunctional glycosyltransferase/CDP-glycerol:glycerophosphate glycerophosphotransferase n=1 Tax=Paramicrobacterium chengjingii TaxID=2769067 RepID=UPI001421DD29|nr:CDP-glycerol glycerophosphotransferase family protein [Microbacterium chengjingii]